MNEDAHDSECHTHGPVDAKEAFCPQCLTPRQSTPLRRLCGALLLLLGGIWTLFWGMVVLTSIAALDRGGGPEAVGEAVGGGMMGLIGLFVFIAGIFMLRTAKKPSEHSERKSLIKRSILGGLIGYAVVSTVLIPVIPILNASRIPEQPQVDQGLVRATLFLALNGLPVVGAVLGIIVARRMKTRNPADRPRKGISIARSVVAGLIGVMASFMTWLFLPPILILAGLYRILGLPYTYEDLDGFNLSMVSGVMLAIGAVLGIIAARRMDSEKEPASAEHVDGGAGPDSSTTQPTASLWHRRYPVMLIAACMFCLAAILFWKNAPGTSPALEPSIGVQPGEERTFAGITFCWCPPGSFTMGSQDIEAGRKTNEGPQHAVSFKQGFWMSKYEVTHAQWFSVEGFHPAASRGDANLPMDMIDWHESHYFLRKLNAKGAGTFRLPSEAEWEYACRAGTQTPFSLGETLSKDQAHLDRFTLRPVGSFPGNAWNLCDMHGNVREWCQDAWHEDYTGAPTDGSAWESTRKDEDRVFRSAAYDRVDRGDADRRSASRWHAMPGRHDEGLGFRIVRSP